MSKVMHSQRRATARMRAVALMLAQSIPKVRATPRPLRPCAGQASKLVLLLHITILTKCFD
eukprot:2565538-Pleurochrysis_carterae.AAC.2